MKKPSTKKSAQTPASAAGAAVPSAGSALRLGAQETQLSPAQQRLAKLLARIDKFKSQIAELQALRDTYLPLYDSTLEPLRAQHQVLARRMALWLDERLDGKGLTPAQKRAATQILCSLSEMLASGGDEAMAALHDRRSPQSLRQKEEEGADGLRAMMERMLGQPLDLDAQDESLDPLEAVMRASQEKLRQADEAEQAKHEAAQARRQKKPTAAQRKAEQQQEDADTVLRQVYRQLASALHPDRERDPAEQQRKTALMSETNAAYARQDLVALLHLQLRIAQSDTQDLLQQPEARIAAMSLLLKRQVGELEHELFARQEQLEHELGLDYPQRLNADTLAYELALKQEDLKSDLQAMASDLALVQQDDASFKRWLKEQARLSRRPDYF